MSAFNARKYNPVIGELYGRPVCRGKTFKRAMTACMRELLAPMNTLAAWGRRGMAVVEGPRSLQGLTPLATSVRP
jgi:hypothetical protein